eukprot:2155588-Prymnesium_polylepis.1
MHCASFIASPVTPESLTRSEPARSTCHKKGRVGIYFGRSTWRKGGAGRTWVWLFVGGVWSIGHKRGELGVATCNLWEMRGGVRWASGRAYEVELPVAALVLGGVVANDAQSEEVVRSRREVVHLGGRGGARLWARERGGVGGRWSVG